MPYTSPPPPKPQPPRPGQSPPPPGAPGTGEPGTARSGSVGLGIAAGVGAGLVAVVAWAGLYKLGLMTNNGMPPVPWWSLMLNSPLAGVLVGLGVRLGGQSREPAVGIAAVGTTIVACFIGYVVVDLTMLKWTINGQPVQPTLADAAGRFFNDFMKILLVAVGCWIAYAIGRKPQ